MATNFSKCTGPFDVFKNERPIWESFALAHLIQGTLSSIRLGRQLKIDLTDFIMSIGMKESKYKYSQYSSFQAAASKNLAQFLDKAAEQISEDTSPVVQIADFGCGDGRNTLNFLTPIVTELSSLKDVVINFVDVSSEQGDQLRKNIEESPLIFPKGNAFATTVTRSYDQKSFPTEYLNIVHSGFTLNWLTTSVPVKNHILACLSADDTVRIKAREQAAQDLRAFLTSRAAEMKPGSYLLSTFTSLSDDKADGSTLQIERLLDEAWAALLDKNVISEAEYSNFTLPMWPRTSEEVSRILAEPDVRSDYEMIALTRLDKSSISDSQKLAAIDYSVLIQHTGVSYLSLAYPFAVKALEPVHGCSGVEAIFDLWLATFKQNTLEKFQTKEAFLEVLNNSDPGVWQMCLERT